MVNDGLKKGKRGERGGNVHVDPAFPFEDGKEPVSLYCKPLLPQLWFKNSNSSLDWNSKA